MARLVLAGLIASLGLATPAFAAPTIGVTTSCAYGGERYAVVGTGFDPNQSVTLEVMGLPDPMAGAPVDARVAMVDASGRLLEILDPPQTAGIAPTLRSLRVRRSDDARPVPDLLASTQLRVAGRGVEISDGAAASRAGSTQRYRVTGLPEGTRLYAHYRRGGKTVARTALGQATDPCGRLSFDLRALPRGHERAGMWELWLTADRTFRRPRRGVYVRRRLRSEGSSTRSRVRFGELRARVAPIDPRLRGPVTNGMVADASRTGLISLTFVGARGATVDFLERVGDRLRRLGTSIDGPEPFLTVLSNATTWSCARTERRFVATATLPDGARALATYNVRTPSCRSRFELSAPARVKHGRLARVRILDRWGTGAISPRLCVTPPRGRRSCRSVRFASAVTVVSRRYRGAKRGRWRVELRVRGRRMARTSFVVGGDGPTGTRRLPTVLATGDSTMQGIDGFLADELRDTASLSSDVWPGSAISRVRQPALPGAADPAAFQWGLLAAGQVERLRPRATVVSLGAAEGFAMTTPDGSELSCCDEAWGAEYSRRVRLLMGAYARNGRALVVWLTLPLPEREARLVPTRAVNAAIVAAAAGLEGVVTVIRLDAFFTPDGFRKVMRYRGRDVDVRDIDGIHLNVAGTAIAARIVARELRRQLAAP